MRDDWLNLVQEEILEPQLPICDPHHHLWDHDENPYLLPQLLADVNSGHNIRSTVFVECASMYRADPPQAMQPVGETEFVNGVAAMTATRRVGTPLMRCVIHIRSLHKIYCWIQPSRRGLLN